MKGENILDLLEKGYQAEKDFISTLPESERQEAGNLERWTAKDTIAHNSHWRIHHAENVLSRLAGASPVATNDIDHANEAIYNQYRDRSWEAVEALARDSYERMRAALQALKEADLQSVDFYPWQEGRPLWRSLAGNVYTHPYLHLSDWHIQRGNPGRAAELYQEMTRQLSNLDDSPEWQGTIRYNLACSYSLAGESEKAIRELGEALKMVPDLIEWSRQDPDFEPIRGEPGYEALYE